MGFLVRVVRYSVRLGDSVAHQLGIEFRQAWLTVVVENQNGVDHIESIVARYTAMTYLMP